MRITIRYNLLLIASVILLSCNKSNHPAIDVFNEMQEHQHNFDFEKLRPSFDDRSLKFIDKLISARSIDDLITVGAKYNLNYFMAEYYRRNRTFDSDFESIIKFFNLLQFSFFDLRYQFGPLQNKAKYYDDNYYLPIVFSYYGVSEIKWLRFTKDNKGIYKFDLVYALRQIEKDYKERYEHNIPATKVKGGQADFHILYTVLPEIKRTDRIDSMTFKELTRLREH